MDEDRTLQSEIEMKEWNGILGYMNRSESLRLEAREQLGLDAMVEAKRKIKSRRSLVV